MNLEKDLKNAIKDFNEAIEQINLVNKRSPILSKPILNSNVAMTPYNIRELSGYVHGCFLTKYYEVEGDPYLNFYENNQSFKEKLARIYSILEKIMDDFCLCEISEKSSIIYSSQIKEDIKEKELFNLLYDYYYFTNEFDKAIDLTKKILNICEQKRTDFSPYYLSKKMIEVCVTAEKFTEVYDVIGAIDYEFFYEKYPYYTIEDVDINDELTDVYYAHRKSIEGFDKSIKEKSDLYEKLQKKERELEEIMSMFAHKFRSPLDAIIYNTHHENNPKLYIEAAQTMRGLLDVFSMISTDEKILKKKIKSDNKGDSRLVNVLSKTIKMMLLHLLSSSSKDKIHQHYMNYAKNHEKIDSSITGIIWNQEYYELESAIQAEWEHSFSELLKKSNTLQEYLSWIEYHFFKIEIIGFERSDIEFKDYSVTESFLTILFNEILVNAFKYYSSEKKQPVTLELKEYDGNQVFICRNPSVKSERTTIKGSGKGHVFLSALASKIGSKFSKPKPQDEFVTEFSISNELLISK